MVQLRSDCDCKTCKGGSNPSKDVVFGGWKCICSCHVSGFPVDSEEHTNWMREQLADHLRTIIEAEENLDDRRPKR